MIGYRGMAVLQKTVWENPYIPHIPFLQQRKFLAYEGLEALYGGAAGGGKSDCLLMAALQYVMVPGYRALLLRRTYSDLNLPGALMDRAREWLVNTSAKWSETDKTWTFPSGATLTFGYLETENDKYRYQSAEFQFIGMDELTQFPEDRYRYMFSRLRKLKDFPVPVRMRAATNPGGIGNDWVLRKFPINTPPMEGGPIFIPARLFDNPYLDQEGYVTALEQLDHVTREQLLNGRWDVSVSGEVFTSDPHLIPVVPKEGLKFFAACDPSEGGADFTAIVVIALLPDGRWLVYDCDINRGTLSTTINKLLAMHSMYNFTKVWIEANSLGHAKSAPGESLFETELRRRQMVYGVILPYELVWNTVKKADRIRAIEPFYSNGQLVFRDDYRVKYPELINQLRAFPGHAHDDGPDALSTLLMCLQRHLRSERVDVVRVPMFTKDRWSVKVGQSKWSIL
ncbi:MAG TPA: phage terminase large subunit [Methanothrix sp.]|nr:phage terminase large subunit [Methanothrix sp.]HOL44757.1 phage terminase large subunit [Methanothrix sp.]HPO89448.1 phage terminase large subunit [Methanothrix sp.]